MPEQQEDGTNETLDFLDSTLEGIWQQNAEAGRPSEPAGPVLSAAQYNQHPDTLQQFQESWGQHTVVAAVNIMHPDANANSQYGVNALEPSGDAPLPLASSATHRGVAPCQNPLGMGIDGPKILAQAELQAQKEAMQAELRAEHERQQAKLQAREEAMQAKEEVMRAKEEAMRTREKAMRTREKAMRAKEEAMRAKEEAMQAEHERQQAELQAQKEAMQAKLQAKEKAMRAKEKELQAKAEELQAKAEELQAKAKELQTKAEELQAKAEELEAREKEPQAQKESTRPQDEARAEATAIATATTSPSPSPATTPAASPSPAATPAPTGKGGSKNEPLADEGPAGDKPAKKKQKKKKKPADKKAKGHSDDEVLQNTLKETEKERERININIKSAVANFYQLYENAEDYMIKSIIREAYKNRLAREKKPTPLPEDSKQVLEEYLQDNLYTHIPGERRTTVIDLLSKITPNNTKERLDSFKKLNTFLIGRLHSNTAPPLVPHQTATTATGAQLQLSPAATPAVAPTPPSADTANAKQASAENIVNNFITWYKKMGSEELSGFILQINNIQLHGKHQISSEKVDHIEQYKDALIEKALQLLSKEDTLFDLENDQLTPFIIELDRLISQAEGNRNTSQDDSKEPPLKTSEAPLPPSCSIAVKTGTLRDTLKEFFSCAKQENLLRKQELDVSANVEVYRDYQKHLTELVGSFSTTYIGLTLEALEELRNTIKLNNFPSSFIQVKSIDANLKNELIGRILDEIIVTHRLSLEERIKSYENDKENKENNTKIKFLLAIRLHLLPGFLAQQTFNLFLQEAGVNQVEARLDQCNKKEVITKIREALENGEITSLTAALELCRELAAQPLAESAIDNFIASCKSQDDKAIYLGFRDQIVKKVSQRIKEGKTKGHIGKLFEVLRNLKKPNPNMVSEGQNLDDSKGPPAAARAQNTLASEQIQQLQSSVATVRSNTRLTSATAAAVRKNPKKIRKAEKRANKANKANKKKKNLENQIDADFNRMNVQKDPSKTITIDQDIQIDEEKINLINELIDEFSTEYVKEENVKQLLQENGSPTLTTMENFDERDKKNLLNLLLCEIKSDPSSKFLKLLNSYKKGIENKKKIMFHFLEKNETIALPGSLANDIFKYFLEFEISDKNIQNFCNNNIGYITNKLYEAIVGGEVKNLVEALELCRNFVETSTAERDVQQKFREHLTSEFRRLNPKEYPPKDINRDLDKEKINLIRQLVGEFNQTYIKGGKVKRLIENGKLSRNTIIVDELGAGGEEWLVSILIWEIQSKNDSRFAELLNTHQKLLNTHQNSKAGEAASNNKQDIMLYLVKKADIMMLPSYLANNTLTYFLKLKISDKNTQKVCNNNKDDIANKLYEAILDEEVKNFAEALELCKNLVKKATAAIPQDPGDSKESPAAATTATAPAALLMVQPTATRSLGPTIPPEAGAPRKKMTSIDVVGTGDENFTLTFREGGAAHKAIQALRETHQHSRGNEQIHHTFQSAP
jgi:hypothetical protein